MVRTMVNGNDLIEFQEEYLPELWELEQLLDEMEAKYPRFVEKVKELVSEFIEEEYTDAQAGIGDMLLDQWKERGL